jgi:hypothetical protein
LVFFVVIGGGGGWAGDGGGVSCTAVLKRTFLSEFEVAISDDVDADIELRLLLSDNVNAAKLHTTRLVALELIVFADSSFVDPILLAIITGLFVKDAARIF